LVKNLTFVQKLQLIIEKIIEIFAQKSKFGLKIEMFSKKLSKIQLSLQSVRHFPIFDFPIFWEKF